MKVKKKKRERRKKSNKGASMENSGTKRQNIVFPFFSRATMARRGASSVFRKNTPPPAATPARGMSICIFSTPVLPLRLPPSSARRVISCFPMANAGLANFETKTSAESKTKLVLRLFVVAKQGRCKTTIKTLV